MGCKLISVAVVLLGIAVSWAKPMTATEVVATVRHICDLPRPGNNGKVVGHDVGWSQAESYNGYYYYFFGDTIVDADGNWTLDFSVDKFKPGTYLARAAVSDDPSDCLDLEYKVDGAGEAAQLIPQLPNETFVWPGGAVVVSGTLYSYYGAYRSIPHGCSGGACVSGPKAGEGCTQPNDCNELVFEGSGLARLTTGATASDVTAERLGTYFFADHDISGPIVATEPSLCGAIEYVYLFVTTRTDPVRGREISLVRVPTVQIEDPAKYRYYRDDGGTALWVPNFSDATPILVTNDSASTFSVHYDESEGRYRSIYSCGFLAPGWCTSTAVTAGDSGVALYGTWSTPLSLYDCPGKDPFRCYQASVHEQYGAGATQYVSAAHNWQGTYLVALREVTFGSYSFFSDNLGYSPLPPCRLADTRNDPEPFGPVPVLQPFGKRKFVVADSCGVPSDAVAVSLNITALEPVSTGYLTVYPRDAIAPPTSNMSFHPSQSARANNMIVKLAADGSGEIEIINGSFGALGDLLVDVSGYFTQSQ